jgi:phosphoribosylglycinamide formyltransferase-1
MAGTYKIYRKKMINPSIAILISGYGKNMEAIFKASKKNDLKAKIKIVIANTECKGIHTAKELGLKTLIINRKEMISKNSFEKKLLSILVINKIDIICLAGFMEILSKGFIKHWDNKILNIHPSLLPLFPGLNTHKRALEAGMSVHGATVHIVTEQIDKGPILSQGVVRVFKTDNETKLKKRVSEIEHILYPKTISEFVKNLNNNKINDIDLKKPKYKKNIDILMSINV